MADVALEAPNNGSAENRGDGSRSGRAQRLALVAIALAFVVARIAVIAGRPAVASNDTPSYMVFGWWGKVRFPTVPALYALLGRSHYAIVWVQCVVSIVAWLAVAFLCASVRRAARARVFVVAALLILGATNQVAGWDLALLSESLSISLTVLLLGFTWRLLQKTTWPLIAATAMLFVLWEFCRQAHAYVGAMYAIGIGLLVLRRHAERKMWGVLCVWCLCFTAIGSAASTANADIRFGLLSRVVCVRVFPVPARLQWFQAHGMPNTTFVPSRDQLTCIRQSEHDQRFLAWLRGPGYPIYSKYVRTHPAYVARGILERSTLVALIAGPRVPSARSVLPWPLTDLIWPNSLSRGISIGCLWVMIGSASYARSLRRRQSHGRGLLACSFVAASVLPQLIIVWIGLPAPFQRQMVVVSVVLRFAMIMTVGALNDGARPGHRLVRHPRDAHGSGDSFLTLREGT